MLSVCEMNCTHEAAAGRPVGSGARHIIPDEVRRLAVSKLTRVERVNRNHRFLEFVRVDPLWRERIWRPN